MDWWYESSFFLEQMNKMLFSLFVFLCKGMFPQTGEWAGGEAAFPAAIKALDQINQREDILPGYYLNLSAYDTQVTNRLSFLLFFSFNCFSLDLF